MADSREKLIQGLIDGLLKAASGKNGLDINSMTGAELARVVKLTAAKRLQLQLTPEEVKDAALDIMDRIGEAESAIEAAPKVSPLVASALPPVAPPAPAAPPIPVAPAASALPVGPEPAPIPLEGQALSPLAGNLNRDQLAYSRVKGAKESIRGSSVSAQHLEDKVAYEKIFEKGGPLALRPKGGGPLTRYLGAGPLNPEQLKAAAKTIEDAKAPGIGNWFGSEEGLKGLGKGAEEVLSEAPKGKLARMLGLGKKIPGVALGALDLLFLPGQISEALGLDKENARKDMLLRGQLQRLQQPSIESQIKKQDIEELVQRRQRLVETGDPGLAQLLQGLPETTKSEIIIGGPPPNRQAFRQFVMNDAKNDGTVDAILNAPASGAQYAGQ